MPELKLTYFDIRGRAEPIRLALTIGSVPFTETRLVGKDWPATKPKTPYGSLPVLQVDGRDLAQSNSILRYVGKLASLYPEDPEEALRVDEVLDTMEDLLRCAYRYRGDDKERLREERDKFVKEDVPRYLGAMLKRLDEGVWCVAGKVSVADLVVTHFVTNIVAGVWDYVEKDMVEKEYERAYSIYQAVMEMDAVKEWYDKHPVKIMS